MKQLALAATIAALACSGAYGQSLDDLKNDGKNTDNILTYGMGYHQQPLQPAEADQQDHGQAAGAGLEPQPRQQLRRAGAADRLQRRDVRHQRASARSRSTSATGKQIWKQTLDWPAGDAARRVLRRLQQGRRDLQRQGLPHHARRPRGRARRQDRQGDLEDRRPPSGRKATR